MAIKILSSITNMGKEKERRTTTCRNCGHTLEYEDGATSVYCGYCDTSTDITSSGSVSPSTSGEAAASSLTGMAAIAVKNMKTPETAMRYLRALEASYDFSFIESNPFAMVIPELEDVVDELKLTAGEDPMAWEFSIRVHALPLQKKIDYLGAVEARLAESFSTNDEATLFGDFDLYRNSIRALKEKKESVFKGLEADLSELKALSKGKSEAETLVAGLKKAIDGLPTFTSPYEVPSVKKQFELRNKEYAEELLAKGIVAETQYQSAIEAMERGDNLAALNYLILLGDYKDSRDLVRKLNTYSVVNDLLTIGNKRYYFASEAVRAEENEKTGKLRQAAQNAAQSVSTSRALVIRDIVDEEPNLKGQPLVKNIKSVIDSFGTYLYYLGTDGKMHFRDLAIPSATDKILDNNGGYFLDELKRDKAKGVDYFVQKRPKKPLLKKGKQDPSENYNKLRLCRLDLYKGDVAYNVVISEFDRIAYWKGDFVGYWKSIMDPYVKRGCALFRQPPTFHKEYSVFRLSTGEDKPLLKFNDEIVFIDGTKIYFTRFLNTKYNLALHVIDYETEETEMILDNIYSAIMIDHGKIYYTIGNTNRKTLFSYDLQTHEKKEIQRRFDGFADCFGGYFYLYRGYGYNRALIKKRIDGTGEPIALAMGMDDGPRFFKNGYFFYTKRNPFAPFGGRSLHKVRVDGKEDKCLDSGVRKVLSIGDERIYFSVDEYVDEKFTGLGGTEKVAGLSLYSFDMFGDDLRKEIFAFDAIEVFDDHLIYSVKETATFKYRVAKRENVTVRRLEDYYRYDLKTMEQEHILLTGYPHDEETLGCFRKKKHDIEYERIPTKKPYDKEELK